MGSVSFTTLLNGRPALAYVWLPLMVSLTLLGFYFSGVAALQNLIVPDIKWLEQYSKREFGLLEMLQNLLLAVIIFYWARSLGLASGANRIIVVLGLGISIFVLLEEIDYGAHLAEYLSLADRSSEAGWSRNLHNRTLTDGLQVGHYLKLTANISTMLLFVVAPLFLRNISHPLVRILVPSRWIIASTLLMVLLARLAHWLDDMGLGVIDGQDGYLSSNISEFRELNFYYLLLVYVAGLYMRLRPAGTRSSQADAT